MTLISNDEKFKPLQFLCNCNKIYSRFPKSTKKIQLPRLSFELPTNQHRQFDPPGMDWLCWLAGNSKFHFLGLQNSKRNQKRYKILNLHDGLLSYQPTSTANSAHQGWIGCAGWLVAQRRNVIGFQTNVFLNPYGMSFHAVAIFSLEVTTLLDSSWAHCGWFSDL